MKRYLAAVTAVAALGFTGLASTAAAQPTQNGLVNLNISDNTVRVPVAVAANLCNLNVAVLAAVRNAGGTTDCTAMSTATAPATVSAPSTGAPTQTGLINVNVSGNTVVIPIAAAVNVCGVNAAILAVQELLGTGTGSCTATSNASG